MKRYPGILKVAEVIDSARSNSVLIDDGLRYVPARPWVFRHPWQRFRAAWMVFVGKADALIWEGQ